MGLLLGERVRLSENSPRTGHKEPQRAPNVAEGLRRAKVGDQVTRLQGSAVACWDCSASNTTPNEPVRILADDNALVRSKACSSQMSDLKLKEDRH